MVQYIEIGIGNRSMIRTEIDGYMALSRHRPVEE